MFYKGSGGLKSMFFEVISAAQKSEEKHRAIGGHWPVVRSTVHKKNIKQRLKTIQ